ncbi:cystathionine beta-lyase [Maricaulis sp.]|uniref:cystathionine beta-lyase n=1 Tax=Maricaulis sp. TaxID=1486257 RepID=UPI00261C40FC|nr:cystathionine beta-lyase [Maricaulis sp.]
MKDATRLTRLGRAHGERGLVNAPVERASTILAPSAGELYNAPPGRPHYGRVGMATQSGLREALCDLQGGQHCALTSSGLQANALAVLSAVEAGGTVLAADCIYGPVRGFLLQTLKRFGVEVRFVSSRAGGDIEAQLDDSVQAILLESPGSLTMEIQDLEAIASIAREHGVTTIIDDTWSAGLTMKPLELGIDLAAQALTKYIGGHSDVMLGAVVAGSEQAAKRLADTERTLGMFASPDDAFLVLRGLRTLEMRMQKSGASGLQIADWLATRPEIGRIYHPARPDHEDHERYKRWFTGPAGLFSFELLVDDVPRAEHFMDQLKLFGIGYSWGGYESLIIHCDPQLRRSAGDGVHSGTLMRLAVGLEDPEDLIGDLERGLAAISVG